MESVSLANKQRHWLNHIRLCTEQGLTAVEYCKKNRLCRSMFYSYKKSLRRKGIFLEASPVTGGFTEVQTFAEKVEPNKPQRRASGKLSLDVSFRRFSLQLNIRQAES